MARFGLIACGEFDMSRARRLQRTLQTLHLIGRQMTYRFAVDFDPEADVWYVRDSTLPGLRTEAPSIDALVGKLRVMVPDLLAASKGWPHRTRML